MGKSVPAPSNYTGAAEQTAGSSANVVNAQTQQNRPNINSGVTSQQWTTGPDGTPTLTQGYGAAEGIAGNLRQQAEANSAAPTGEAARQGAIDQTYGRLTQRLDPQWARNGELEDSKLANMGIDPNSAAAHASRMDFANARNDAYSGARQQALDAGHTAFQDNMQASNNPLQQLLALSGVSGPQYNTAGQSQATDYFGASRAQDSAAMQQWQAQQKQISDLINGIGQIGGVAAKAFSFGA